MILKVSDNVSIPNPGNYGVRVEVTDADGNVLATSSLTPVNVPSTGGDIIVGPPDVTVIA